MRSRSPTTADAPRFVYQDFLWYTLITVALMLPVGILVLGAEAMSRDSEAHVRAAARSRAGFRRLANDLRSAVAESVSLRDAHALECSIPSGTSTNLRALTPERVRFSIRLDPGETLNREDDDGDGTIDEGYIVRTDVKSGTETKISHGIDVGASQFSVENGLVSVTLSHAEIDGVAVTRTLKVSPRN
ncbi:MAG: hypothetical protein AAF517_18890 [Planctomycetota bacterium]